MTRALPALLLLAACGGGAAQPKAPAVKPPVEDLIFGIYERHPPQGTTAMKLARDGSIVVAHEKDKLDDDKPLASGSWKLEKDTLTLSYSMGMCADGARTGQYKVGVTKMGIHFTKIADDCAQRAKMDGETWWRVRPKINE